MVIQLKVNGIRGEERIIKVCETEEQLKKITVLELKKVVTTELKIDCDFRLAFKSGTMVEASLVTLNGIQHMSNIFVMPIQPGGL